MIVKLNASQRKRVQKKGKKSKKTKKSKMRKRDSGKQVSEAAGTVQGTRSSSRTVRKRFPTPTESVDSSSGSESESDTPLLALACKPGVLQKAKNKKRPGSS
jgi:hypothetical protein